MTDAELIVRWRSSILHYVEDVWKLTPQPLKQNISPDLPSEEYDQEMFEPFVKGKHVTWQQWLFYREIDQSIAKGEHVFLSVASGHGTGKSMELSTVILWGLTCWVDAQIGCTAPTADQMYDVLWKEVARWHRKMPQALADCFEIQSAYVRVRERPETWWARARTARKENPEALAGLHGEVVIFIVDEASGVPEEIFEVAQGALTGKFVLFIMVSNPTRLSGYFYDSHHKNRDRWRRLRLNSRQSPIVESDFVDRMEQEYGKDSPQVKVRVDGEFPDSEEDQLIARSLFDAAVKRTPHRDLAHTRIMGVDVARYGGDKSVLAERQGTLHKHLKTRSDQDTVATANDVMAEVRKAEEEGNPYDFICVDIIGIGAGVYDTLMDRQMRGELSRSIQLLAVNVSETAEDEIVYHGKRVELWWRFKHGLLFGSIDRIFGDDACAVKVGKPDNRGRNTLEDKEKTKERIGHSPDHGDSIVLTYAVLNNRRENLIDHPVYQDYSGGRLAA